jgi:hypothetical protein
LGTPFKLQKKENEPCIIKRKKYSFDIFSKGHTSLLISKTFWSDSGLEE